MDKIKDIIQSNNYILVDVREKEELKKFKIKEAILIPLSDFLNELKNKNLSHEQNIILFCRSGKRSAKACSILKSLGYKHVYDIGSYVNLLQYFD